MEGRGRQKAKAKIKRCVGKGKQKRREGMVAGENREHPSPSSHFKVSALPLSPPLCPSPGRLHVCFEEEMR